MARSTRFILIVFLLAPILPAAAQEKATGLILADPSAYQSVPLAPTLLHGTLPTSYDLSSNFPEPGDQGGQSSCTAWAVAYALKSYQERVERNWSLGSQDHLFSPSYIYNQLHSGQCHAGTSIMDALNLVRMQGVASLADFPYDARTCSALPSPQTKQAAEPFAVAEWRRVNVQDEVEVKTQIFSGIPVVIGMIVDNAFQNLQRGSIYTSPDNIDQGAHAMVVVGYDDNLRAFKVINSWGASWADGGFGWVGYSAFKSLVREGYTVPDIVLPPRPTPRPTPVPNPVSFSVVAWAYFGIFQHEQWHQRYFKINSGSQLPPAKGDLIEVISPVNLRKDRIREVNGVWTNSEALAILSEGEEFEVLDSLDVAGNGYYWVKIRYQP